MYKIIITIDNLLNYNIFYFIFIPYKSNLNQLIILQNYDMLIKMLVTISPKNDYVKRFFQAKKNQNLQLNI